ncbi:5667_t:CDS:2, partial [Gigaspora margarita]
MNNQYCSAHKTTPYNLVFGQYPYCDTNLVDLLENDQQNEEPNSSIDDFPETDSDMTFVTANNDNNDDNYLDSNTSQVYSITPQEIIEINDSDSSQESVDTIVSQYSTAQEKEKWRASSIEAIDEIKAIFEQNNLLFSPSTRQATQLSQSNATVNNEFSNNTNAININF